MQLTELLIAILRAQVEQGLTGKEQVTFSRDCVATTAWPETGADLTAASAVHVIQFSDGEKTVYLMDTDRCEALLLRQKLQGGKHG